MSEPENLEAFPQHPSQMVGRERVWGASGMSLRDWFAGQALSGFAGSHHASTETWVEERVATSCYAVADAMLAARGQ